MELSTPVGRIQLGNICLIICCLFYLIWWSITFQPGKVFPMAAKYILFFITLAAGVAGIYFSVFGMSGLAADRGRISNAAICAAGIIAYVVLLILTNLLMHRQVTTELLLITGWSILELCAVNSLYRAGFLGGRAGVCAAVVIIAAAVVAMICYLAYYNLEEQAAFYDGMVPLILFAAVMVFLTILIGVSRSS